MIIDENSDPCVVNHFLVTTLYWIKWYGEMKDHN